jgi:hypothetical protein
MAEVVVVFYLELEEPEETPHLESVAIRGLGEALAEAAVRFVAAPLYVPEAEVEVGVPLAEAQVLAILQDLVEALIAPEEIAVALFNLPEAVEEKQFNLMATPLLGFLETQRVFTEQ